MIMKLEFSRKPKKKMVGIRLTDEEYYLIKEIAKKNNETMAETTAVLIRAALKKVESAK